MSEDDIEQQIDDILEALRETSGKEISRDELEKELKKFLEYGVPPEHAKQTLVKKFGGGYNVQPLSSEPWSLIYSQISKVFMCSVVLCP
jgi:hypothetical protein